jgi:hypothetical protein
MKFQNNYTPQRGRCSNRNTRIRNNCTRYRIGDRNLKPWDQA